MADHKIRDEMDELLEEIEKLKDTTGKDWSMAQARKLGMSEEDIRKLFKVE